MAEQSDMVKIRFHGPHPGDVETLWAAPVSGDLYRLDNSPFYAYGVSWQDVIEAQPAADEALDFVKCIRKSGNRTVRVIFQNYRSEDPPAQRVLRRVRDLGCTYEGMQPRMVSVNIPPRVDIDDVTNYLSEESGLQWEYADPTYDEVDARRRT
jgi:hypothetical protein